MTDAPERLTSPIPTFHDGRLTSIAVAAKSAALGLKASDGMVYELRLIGVEGFRADNFLEGNIISEVEVVSGCQPVWTTIEGRLAQLFPRPRPNAASREHAAHEARLVSAAKRVANGDAALVSVECSYGCDLVALCSEVQLIAEPEISKKFV